MQVHLHFILYLTLFNPYKKRPNAFALDPFNTLNSNPDVIKSELAIITKNLNF